MSSYSTSSPSKIDGQKDQVVGNVKDAVGTAVGNGSLAREGQTQHGAGKIQEHAAEATGYIQLAADNLQGTADDIHNKLTGSGPNKTDAKKNQFVGNTKEVVGNAVDNERLQTEGQTQHGAGKIQESAAGLTGLVQGIANQLISAATTAYNSLTGVPSKTDAKKDQIVGDSKQNAGHLVGNRSLQSEGQVQSNAGQIQETAAQVTSYVNDVANQVQGAVTGAYNSLAGNTAGEADAKVQEKKGETQKPF